MYKNKSVKRKTDKINIIINELGEKETQLYIDTYQLANKKFSPYIRKKYDGLTGPFKKVKEYNKINYKEVYERIDQYKKELETNTKVRNK